MPALCFKLMAAEEEGGGGGYSLPKKPDASAWRDEVAAVAPVGLR